MLSIHATDSLYTPVMCFYARVYSNVYSTHRRYIAISARIVFVPSGCENRSPRISESSRQAGMLRNELGQWSSDQVAKHMRAAW